MPACAARDLQIKIFSCIESGLVDFLSPRGLTEDEVHIWKAHGEFEPNVLAELKKSLSEDELQKAARFRFVKDLNRFITSCGMLRKFVGKYLGRDPRSVSFCFSENGKPELAGMDDALRFNVAHSGNLIVWGFARNRRLGIDVELIRVDFGVSEIAERFFSAAEQTALRTLPKAQQHEAFFRCWARKEAYVKATGDGLSLPLDQFDVTLAPGQPSCLLGTRPDRDEAARWAMESLDLGPGYAAALVLERQNSSKR